MREILFRGKDIRGVWHIGLLAHIGNAWYISNKAGVATAYEVIPTTIGQFTGLTAHGKKIFEGDIIRTDNGRKSAVSVVKYGNFRPKMIYDMFQECIGYSPKQYLHGVYCESSKEQMMLFDSPTCIEVIGNIHDNPELLEVE